MTRRGVVAQVKERVVNIEHAKPLSDTWTSCLVLITEV